MTIKRSVALLLTILGLLVLCLWYVVRQNNVLSEARYDGKPVSYWVRKYTRAPRRDSVSGPADAAVERLVQLGTNAVSELLLEQDYESLLPEKVIRVVTLGQRRFSQNDVKINAVHGIKQIGASAIPAVHQALSCKDVRKRKAALTALVNLREYDPDVIPTLIRALRDPELEVSGTSADALGSLGPSAKAAVPEMLNLLSNNVTFPIVLVVGRAVHRIDPQNPELLGLLTHWANAKEIPSLTQREVSFINQSASRLLKEVGSAQR